MGETARGRGLYTMGTATPHYILLQNQRILITIEIK